MAIRTVISKALKSSGAKPLVAGLIVLGGLGVNSLMADAPSCNDNGGYGWNVCDDECAKQGLEDAGGCAFQCKRQTKPGGKLGSRGGPASGSQFGNLAHRAAI